MRKIIEITEEIERHLACICDFALKAGGMNAFNSVLQLHSAIKEDILPFRSPMTGSLNH